LRIKKEIIFKDRLGRFSKQAHFPARGAESVFMHTCAAAARAAFSCANMSQNYFADYFGNYLAKQNLAERR
jgi:hypothetical protein